MQRRPSTLLRLASLIFALALWTGFTPAVIAQDTSLPTEWTIQTVPLPNEASSAKIRGLNEAGRAVGDWFDYTKQFQVPFLVVEGELRLLGEPESGGYATAISDDGVVVGYRIVDGGTASEGGILRSGSFESLGPGGATDINAAGEISGLDGVAPVVWKNGVAEPLESSPDWAGGYPLAMNDTGMLAGQAVLSANQLSVAVAWSDGELIELGVPPDETTYAVDVNNAGQVLGFTHIDYIPHPWIWQDGTFTDLSNGSNEWCMPSQINESGLVIGQCSSGDGLVAVVWTGGDPVDLNTLMPGNVLMDGQAINDSGQMAGYGYQDDNIAMLWVLTPGA